MTSPYRPSPLHTGPKQEVIVFVQYPGNTGDIPELKRQMMEKLQNLPLGLLRAAEGPCDILYLTVHDAAELAAVRKQVEEALKPMPEAFVGIRIVGPAIGEETATEQEKKE